MKNFIMLTFLLASTGNAEPKYCEKFFSDFIKKTEITESTKSKKTPTFNQPGIFDKNPGQGNDAQNIYFSTKDFNSSSYVEDLVGEGTNNSKVVMKFSPKDSETGDSTVSFSHFSGATVFAHEILELDQNCEVKKVDVSYRKNPIYHYTINQEACELLKHKVKDGKLFLTEKDAKEIDIKTHSVLIGIAKRIDAKSFTSPVYEHGCKTWFPDNKEWKRRLQIYEESHPMMDHASRTPRLGK